MSQSITTSDWDSEIPIDSRKAIETTNARLPHVHRAPINVRFL